MSTRAVLLVGSAKPTGTSTSEALGRYLVRRMELGGAMETRVFHVSHCRQDAELAELAAAVDRSDLFILATPLYVDTLPFLVTRALEVLAAARTRPGAAPRLGTRFVAVVNCGLPEAAQTRTAQDICRIFAHQARLELAGTLGLGGGETVQGRSPESMGWLARHVRRALDLTADALLAGGPVPQKAVDLMARPLIPAIGYMLLADRGWRKQARRFGTEAQLFDRPYEPTRPATPLNARAAPPPIAP